MITGNQLLLAVSIPTIVALIGIIWNNVQLISLRNEIRADVISVRADVESKMGEVRTLFNHFIDRHINNENRLSTLEERTKPKAQ